MITILEGYAAIAVSDKWIGVIKGSIYCNKLRKSSSKALKDAEKLFKKHWG